MPHNLDEQLIEPDRQRIELVQRPLVGLVELARGCQDSQLGEPTPERAGKPKVSARAMEPQSRGSRRGAP